MSLDLAQALLQLTQVTALETDLTQHLAHACDEKLSVFDSFITDKRLIECGRSLFLDGYYALAVEECCKCLANEVKRKSGVENEDGYKLMFTVFNMDKPQLLLNDLRTTSERDEQRGYSCLFAGVMAGIRNPRAHEEGYLDEPNLALELIGIVQHLIGVVDRSKKAT